MSKSVVPRRSGSGSTATPAEIAKIRRLYKKGLGRNAIAKEIGRSWQYTGTVCKKLGLLFDPTQTKIATAVAVAGHKERLAAIAERLITRSETLLTRLEAEQYGYTVVVPGKGPMTVTDTAPPAMDEKNLSMSAATYLREATRLVDRVDDTGVTKVKSMIEKMSEALGLNDG